MCVHTQAHTHTPTHYKNIYFLKGKKGSQCFGDPETLYVVVEHSQRLASYLFVIRTCLLGVGEGGQGFLFQCFQWDSAGTEELHAP